MQSKAAIAQSDIQTFYDSLNLLKIAFWLVSNGVPACAVACLLRHQLIPQVWLHTGDARIPVQNRSIGGLTGSRLAGCFGRIPVEDLIAQRSSAWRTCGFDVDNVPLMLCTYVDNLFSCSNSVRGATQILDDAEHYLKVRWGHTIKASSRCVMACHGLQ